MIFCWMNFFEIADFFVQKLKIAFYAFKMNLVALAVYKIIRKFGSIGNYRSHKDNHNYSKVPLKPLFSAILTRWDHKIKFKVELNPLNI